MHGGNVYEYRMKYGKDPLDFSANVNPLGAPGIVKAAVAEAMERIDLYPDPECTKLREAVAAHEGVSADDVLCGAGASDLIFRYVCAMRPQRTLIITPAFSEYEKALRLYDSQIIRHELREENDFKIDETILKKIDGTIDLLILNIPHNPTGLVPDTKLVDTIINKCDDSDVHILSDECFIDFMEDPKEHTLIGKKNTTVIRAFTKYHGLAGLRLGYAIGPDRELMKKMKAAGPCWNVSTVAQAAGMSVLGYDRDVREDIKKEREFLTDQLTGLDMRVIPSAANYILFYSEDHRLHEKLYEKGILIRDCSDFYGLKSGWYRIAVKKHEDNLKLLEMIR
ncbi:MAG: aminotransferase class I/II-fold pyridoxal phosphate-dependent enzyme [Lachnospiraceae bacterium]|nr:aminotransferase class I/II-fold pyridoxal phosphate-dependent enzyme [Lachnospiraceae bacterium]